VRPGDVEERLQAERPGLVGAVDPACVGLLVSDYHCDDSWSRERELSQRRLEGSGSAPALVGTHVVLQAEATAVAVRR
jgi:hypothetical protein